jgi:pantoate--beta-alanine ligase
MQILRERHELTALATLPRPLGLVATMGALHAGHVALVAAARAQCARVVASIFVNPTQFNDSADFSRYPRDEAADLAIFEAAGCAAVWLPDVAQMYPPGDATMLDPAGPAIGWEGDARPGHFRGMATVVAKLFGLLRPDQSFFGEKDWQQLQVVRRFTADLLLPVEIVGVPTVREADGLALSSRNRLLEPAERARAPLIYACLEEARLALPWRGAAEALAHGRERLAAAGFGVDYFALVEAATLRPSETAAGGRLIAAARLGQVRLLDNIAA